MADILDKNNNIQSGLRADIMRRSMETKALLTEKGDLYVGTGDKEKVDEYDLYKTTVLHLPQEEVGSQIILTTNTDKNSDSGLKWSSITSNMIQPNSISLNSLAGNLVNTNPKADEKGILTVSLKQDKTKNQIQLDYINFNAEALSGEVCKYNNIPSISSVDGVLTIQINDN